MGKKIISRVLASALCAAFLASGAAAIELVPVGQAVGIELKTKGMLVASLSKVSGPSGESAPAAAAGIAAGDVIVRLGDKEVCCAEDFTKASEKLSGEPVGVTVLRCGKLIQYTVKPALCEDGSYKLGLWLRSGAAGIGTVTFYDPASGRYGALGHSVNDVDTGVALPVGEGHITGACVTGVVRGECSAPGELSGAITDGEVIGDIEANTERGIFGALAVPFEGEAILAAEDSDIRSGPATILATVDGEGVREYAINITRGARGADDRLTIEITDEALIEKTGGIVQGMSGCPILQNGALVGAVTHVLLSDPARGYGITIGSMLRAADIPAEEAA